MAVSAFRMPHTVPNRPTKGAVEPTVARKPRPPEILLFTSATARSTFIVTQLLWSMFSVRAPSWCSEASTAVAGDVAEGAFFLQALDAVIQAGLLKEGRADFLGFRRQLAGVPQADNQDVPRAHGHDAQDDQHDLVNDVAVGNDVGQAVGIVLRAWRQQRAAAAAASTASATADAASAGFWSCAWAGEMARVAAMAMAARKPVMREIMESTPTERF